jgi:surface antigen
MESTRPMPATPARAATRDRLPARGWRWGSVLLALTLSAAACGDAGSPLAPGREPAAPAGRVAYASPSVCGGLLPGEELAWDVSVRSCNGVAMLILQPEPEQNVVLYDSAGALWSAPNTLHQGTAVLRMQEDGNLVAYNGVMTPLWSTGTAGHPNAWLAVQNDCNLVIYAGPYPQGGAVLWASNTTCRAPQPAPGRMLPGDRLSRSVSVSSINGNATLQVQDDQNVVLYNRTVALWSAPNTANHGTSVLVMQGDGNLVAYNGSGVALWASGTAGHPGAWLQIQDDCNLVIYRGPYPQGNGALWATNTASSACSSSTSGATQVTNDYPYPTADPNAVDPWNFYYRQCTSFAAWRIRTRTRATSFTNQYAGVARWGNATSWDDAARSAGAQAAGVRLYAQPAVGRIAQWEAGYHGAAGTFGHVAYVAAVYSDGSILVEEYNYSTSLGYDTRRIYPGSNRWPSVFIEF